MIKPLTSNSFNQVFLEARTFNKFIEKDVSNELIKEVYELAKWGPTSMNCQPGRFIFIKSIEEKEKLKPALMPGNQDKTMVAPVTVIVASDTLFYEQLPSQFPVNPNAKAMFKDNTAISESTMLRNSTLQGAYFIMAARMLGLDCGPMSGFDNKVVDDIFFKNGRYKSNFLINIGFGDSSGNHPRGPRLNFDQIAEIQ